MRPWSAHDHSRNFIGKLDNWLMFNAGYHGAHHEQPGLHWSQLPALHTSLAPNIDPQRNEPSLLWFTLRCHGNGVAVCEPANAPGRAPSVGSARHFDLGGCAGLDLAGFA